FLSAATPARRQTQISSGSTIIHHAHQVRGVEDASTIERLSGGRMEVVAGRASRVGLYELLGYSFNDYEVLFEERFQLFLKINENETVNWNGEFRAPLNDA